MDVAALLVLNHAIASSFVLGLVVGLILVQENGASLSCLKESQTAGIAFEANKSVNSERIAVIIS